jgi:dTDP-4-amino-4,6-dideoxygalactose transaminase
MIEVAKPFLPPLDEYQKYIEQIWERNWLTNNGPLVNELELRLKEYLGVKHLLLVSNGTVALQIAIKALNLKSEVITTPFSYVATTSSLVWEGCKPVFVDIDQESFNIDPRLIEQAITEHTTGIMATHVFGNPCNVEAIDLIAKRHNLRVIYDAAHCFGTEYEQRSVLSCGDVSTISFHATKLFHTVEGGAVITEDPELLKAMSYLRNFGHDGPTSYNGAGINGKCSEVHAAMGLANLKYADDILEKRQNDHRIYDDFLKKLELKRPLIDQQSTYNYSYYPVVFRSEKECLNVQEVLRRHNISARRYFYPSLSSLDYVDQRPTPVADNISSRILCLPMYYQLSESEIKMICRLVLRAVNYESGG